MDKTVQYKRTLHGSVGAGVSALFNGKGRRYFILEHKDASKYHRAGESQKIIIDQVEIGRDGSCQVRFDESFETVSRRHAAIVKDGDKWKLIQLSKTNSTLLNGKNVESEWYLENGDEIQLSVGGPRMGFIVPAGKQSLVSSIKMTERLELFRKQALRPYKTAIAALFSLMIILGCGAGYMLHLNHIDIQNLMAKTNNQEAAIIDVKKQRLEDIKKTAEAIKNAQEEAKKKTKVIIPPSPDDILRKELDKVKSSVYAVMTSVYVEIADQKELISRSQGSGFLLDDGRFVTARHCVEPWMFDIGTMQAMYAMSTMTSTVKIYSEIIAVNKDGETISFKSTSCRVDRSYDTPYNFKYELDGEEISLKGALAFGSEASLGNDWAYVQTGQKGSISDGRRLSDKLKGGMTAHLLGFPKSLGIDDGDKIVEPIYNNLSISRDGLNKARCIMVTQGVDKGNSGGPVFVLDNKKLYAIGIVSRHDSNSEHYNHLIPMSNLKQ